VAAKSDPQVGVSVDTGDRIVGAGVKDSTGNYQVITLDASGNVPVSGTITATPTGTQDVNIKQVGGNAVTTTVPVSGTITETNSAAALTALQLIDNAVSGAGFNITQVNGESVDVGAGTEAAAIRVTLPTDGTGKVGLNAGTNNIGDVDILSIAAGDNNIGNVDLASAIPAGTNNIGDVDVLSVIPGTGATNLGKADGGVYASGDTGVAAFGLRVDSRVAQQTQGKYEAIQIASDGSVYVDEVNSAAIKTAVETIDNAVSGSGFNISQVNGESIDVGAGTEAAAIRVTLPTNGTGVIATVGAVTSITNAVTVNSHAVTNAGTFAVQVDGAALTSLQLIDDAIYTDGSGTVTKGIAILGQDGTNPQAIKTDTNGELQVDVLTMPTTTVQATNLDIRDLSSASDSVAVHGDVGVIDQLDLTNSNPAVVAIVDANGDQITSFGGGTQYTEDVAAAADPIGTAQILVRKDTPGTITTTDGDNVAQRGTNYGAAYCQIVTSAGAYVDTFGGGTEYTEDAASVANPVGGQIMARRRDSLSAETTTDGDVTALNCTSKGEVYVKHTDTVSVTGAVLSTFPCIGNVAHDDADTSNPVKIGGKAKTYGSLPTAVTDADRVNGLFDRYGAQFVQMGSPFVQAITAAYTADQTNVDLIGAISAGTAYRIYGYILQIDYASQGIQTTYNIGFGATTTPTTAGCILKTTGLVPGYYEKTFSAPIVGGSGEELRITTTGYTAGTINVTIFYDTISI